MLLHSSTNKSPPTQNTISHNTGGGICYKSRKRPDVCVAQQNLLQYIVHTELFTVHTICYCILHPMNFGNHYHTVNVQNFIMFDIYWCMHFLIIAACQQKHVGVFSVTGASD